MGVLSAHQRPNAEERPQGAPRSMGYAAQQREEATPPGSRRPLRGLLKVRLGVWLAALLLASGTPASAQSPPTACTAPLKPALEVNLYFGRDSEGGGEVTEGQWAEFVAAEVTPRFPDGLSVLNVAGQSRDSLNRTLRERTKLLVVVVFDAPGHREKVREIVDAYNRRFGQHGVFRTEQAVCAGV